MIKFNKISCSKFHGATLEKMWHPDIPSYIPANFSVYIHLCLIDVREVLASIDYTHFKNGTLWICNRKHTFWCLNFNCDSCLA